MGADGHDLIELALPVPLLPQTRFIAPDAPEPCDLAPFGRQWFSPRRPAAWRPGGRAARAALVLDAYLDELLAAIRADGRPAGTPGLLAGHHAGPARRAYAGRRSWRRCWAIPVR
ncbi:MAG: hypothetical protein U1E17_01435 [Geminicoccaceae bacterium]